MESTLTLFSTLLKEKRMEIRDAVTLYKALCWYHGHSGYGRYDKRIAGLPDSVKHLLYSDGVILLRNGEETEMARFLKRRVADIHS